MRGGSGPLKNIVRRSAALTDAYPSIHTGAAHERGEASQLVNMAVGLDGRAFRDLPYPPNTTIYEVDRQEVRREKVLVTASFDALPSFLNH